MDAGGNNPAASLHPQDGFTASAMINTNQDPPPQPPLLESPRLSSTPEALLHRPLPHELQAAICKEVINIAETLKKKRYRARSLRPKLAELATINTEWQIEVERVTFRSLLLNPYLKQDLVDFGKIVVGKRREYLWELDFPIMMHGRDRCPRGLWAADRLGPSTGKHCFTRAVKRVCRLYAVLSTWPVQAVDLRLKLGYLDYDKYQMQRHGQGWLKGQAPHIKQPWNSDLLGRISSTEMNSAVTMLEACPPVNVVGGLECYLGILPPPVMLRLMARLPNLRAFDSQVLSSWGEASEFFDNLQPAAPNLKRLEMWEEKNEGGHLGLINSHLFRGITVQLSEENRRRAERAFVEANDAAQRTMHMFMTSFSSYGQQLQHLTLSGLGGDTLFQEFFAPYGSFEPVPHQSLSAWPSLRRIDWGLDLESNKLSPLGGFEIDEVVMKASMLDRLLLARHAAARLPMLEELNVRIASCEFQLTMLLQFKITDPTSRFKAAVLELSELAACAELEEAWAATISDVRGVPLIVRPGKRQPTNR